MSDQAAYASLQGPSGMSAPVAPPKPISEAVTALIALATLDNIVPHLPEDKINGISDKVIAEYQIDKTSRAKWEEETKDAMDLALLVTEEKSYPFPRASNVKYPLVTTAALQFSARAYPAIVQGNRVVKCSTWGEDPSGQKAARADRVSDYMSYQLLVDQPEWEDDTDRGLLILPIIGSIFRKVWHDPALGRNTSSLITPDRLVVNYGARSLDTVPRVTEELRLYPYEIKERIKSGRFIEFEYGEASPADVSDTEDKEKQPNANDPEAPHLFLEQHRLLDLDDDGYPEPYIVTVHYSSQKVCRIVANYDQDTITEEDGKIIAIRKQQYYVRYLFMPSPDGGFYGMGFGRLLKDIGASINTTLNMMIDAGHITNVQGGFANAQLGIKDKKISLTMGEFRVLPGFSGDIRQAIMPITFPGPSPVLFQLLGLLIEAGKDVTAVKDVLTGEGQGKNASPTTTLALIEQGLQQFTAIYKRIHRALKDELVIHARLNRKYLDPEPYNEFFDDPKQQFDPKADFDIPDKAITPVSDPSTVTKMQRLAKAEFLWQMTQTAPELSRIEVLRRVLTAADVEDIDELLPPPPPPNPEEEILKRILAELALKKQEADIVETKTKALLNVANAEAAEDGTQLAAYSAYLQSMQDMLNAASTPQEGEDGSGRLPGMEGEPGNPMGAGAAIPDSGAGGIGNGAAPAVNGGPIPGGMGALPDQGLQ